MPDNITDDNTSRPSLEEQIRELLRRANISCFSTPAPQSAPPESGSTQDEDHAARLRAIREFSLKPRDIKDYLDRFVIRQDEAKKVLSVAICDHYNHVRQCIENPDCAQREHAKHNILLLGPTGVGKTYLVRCIARLVGVPFVKADATKFSETGYVGHDVEDLVRDLVKAADGNIELAQYGIIFLDEVDKIAAQPITVGRDVSGRGVQVNMLKLMEETEVSLFSQTDLLGQIQAVMDLQRGRGPSRRSINTRHILFIVSGAFDGLADIVRKRVESGTIGFAIREEKLRQDSDYLRFVQSRDLIQYGFEPEFVGRLPIRVVCDPLDVKDLIDVLLKSEESVLTQYRSDLAGYGIEFEIEPEAVQAIAEQAHAERTGARGLMTVLERVFREFKFELPSTPIRFFRVTRETVENAGQALERLLSDKEAICKAQLRRELGDFILSFETTHGLHLEFGPDAAEQVVTECLSKHQTMRSFCAERFRDLEYGLKLIARNTGLTSFRITKRFVEQPDEELSRLIAQSFRRGEQTDAEVSTSPST